MSDKLVTLAIRTYQRAQMIKTVLEEHGIETIIHNLNLEHPEMAVGVRVRIKEKDLPQALAIVEQIEKEWEKENGEEKREKPPILIPIDFSDQVAKSIDFGFEFARKHGTAVKFLYVYYTPMFTISSNNEVSTYSISDGELLRRIVTAANADVENMTNLINKRIDRGELPKVPFSFDLKEGVPEDQILDYCKRFEPALVIMGTRGKKITQTNALIGSVTAEVIDSCLRPVLALPMEMPFDNPDDIRRVAFLTNFDQKDLIAIDSTIKLLAGGVQIASQVIQMDGLVTFTGLEDGTTVINGGCIQTGLINAQYLNLTGSITFSDLSSSVQQDIDDAVATANDAYDMAYDNQLPSYIKNTYIDSARIESPAIYAGEFYGNEFNVYSEGEDGSFNLYAPVSGSYHHMLEISYFWSTGAFVSFDSPAGADATIDFSWTRFRGDWVAFENGVNVDFSNANVTGLYLVFD